MYAKPPTQCSRQADQPNAIAQRTPKNPALAIVVAAGVALIIISVNGQCPPVNEAGVTCATKFSQRLADFGLTVASFALDTGVPLVLAVGGLIFLMRDVRRIERSAGTPAPWPRRCGRGRSVPEPSVVRGPAVRRPTPAPLPPSNTRRRARDRLPRARAGHRRRA